MGSVTANKSLFSFLYCQNTRNTIAKNQFSRTILFLLFHESVEMPSEKEGKRKKQKTNRVKSTDLLAAKTMRLEASKTKSA
jgi:hypothetical protein